MFTQAFPLHGGRNIFSKTNIAEILNQKLVEILSQKYMLRRVALPLHGARNICSEIWPNIVEIFNQNIAEIFAQASGLSVAWRQKEWRE